MSNENKSSISINSELDKSNIHCLCVDTVLES